MERSYLRIYKILLDIAWYSIIIVLLIYFVVNVISSIAYKEIKFGNITPFNVSVELKDFDFSELKNHYSFAMKNSPTTKLELTKIDLSNLADPFILWYLLTVVLGYAIVIFQLKLFRSFISDVIDKKIFTSVNVKRLKLIGVVQLLSIPLAIVVYSCF